MKVKDIQATEYDPFFQGYINRVGDLPLVENLKEGLKTSEVFLKALPREKQEFSYAENKWTPKEILLHLIDSERVFCFRALSFARSENESLSGFDENIFAENSRANARSWEDLLEEYVAVRLATIKLFNSFSDEVLLRKGKVNDRSLSVRAIGFIICGHEAHHKRIITERYLQ